MSSREAPRFYFGAMSPYSWLAAERIDRLLPAARWRGVFAGALFKQNGRVSWGLTDEREQKLADCDARAASYGLGPIRWPDRWPTNDLLVARAMAFCGDEPLLKAYALAAMRLTFLEGADLGELDAVLEAGRRVDIDERELAAGLRRQGAKDTLRAANDEAVAAGAFGVPTVVIGDKLFWGDDRLDEAAGAYRAGS
ncbi:MAG TPA: DsbA family protein [Solirubrobacteraceae bacterium]|nr:DsbA family protein [Solirubrobacteraceae bacterium]